MWINNVRILATRALDMSNIFSNKKDTSDFYGTVSFDPVKISQQKLNQNVYQTLDTQNC